MRRVVAEGWRIAETLAIEIRPAETNRPMMAERRPHLAGVR